MTRTGEPRSLRSRRAQAAINCHPSHSRCATATHLLGVTVYHTYGPAEADGAAPAARLPPGHIAESFLTIPNVLAWRDALAEDLQLPPALMNKRFR